MSIAQKMVSNTFYISLDWFFVMLFTFIHKIVVGKLLLPHDYGIAITTIQFISLVAVSSSIGLSSAIQKLISEYLARKKDRDALAIIRYSFKFILIFSILISIVIFFFSSFLASMIFKDSQFTLLFQIASLGILFYSIVDCTYSIIYGFQRMKVLFITNFIGYLFRIIFSIGLILFGFRFFGPIIGFVLSLLVVIILRLTTIKFNHQGTPDISRIWKYALSAFIGIVCGSLLSQTAPIILSSFSSIDAAGLFGWAFGIATPIFIVSNIFMSSSFPIFSGMYGVRDKSGIEKLLQVVIKYVIFFSIPIILTCLVFPDSLILFLGRSEYLSAVNILRILAITNLIFGVGNVLLNVLYAVGKPTINRNILIITSLTFLPSAIFLATKYSATGVAIAYLIAISLLLFLSTLFIKKFYMLKFDLSALVKIILSSLVVSLFLAFIKQLTNRIFFIGIGVFAGCALYLFLLLILRFFDSNDLLILRRVREKAPRGISKLLYMFECLIRVFKQS